jgi:hypothetical protein
MPVTMEASLRQGSTAPAAVAVEPQRHGRQWASSVMLEQIRSELNDTTTGEIFAHRLDECLQEPKTTVNRVDER